MYYPNNCYCINHTKLPPIVIPSPETVEPPENPRQEHIDQVKAEAKNGKLPYVPIYLGQPRAEAIQIIDYLKTPVKVDYNYLDNRVSRIEKSYPRKNLPIIAPRKYKILHPDSPYLTDKQAIYLYVQPFGKNETYVTLSTTPIENRDLFSDIVDFMRFVDNFYQKINK